MMAKNATSVINAEKIYLDHHQKAQVAEFDQDILLSFLPRFYQDWVVEQADHENYQFSDFLKLLQQPILQKMLLVYLKNKPALHGLEKQLNNSNQGSSFQRFNDQLCNDLDLTLLSPVQKAEIQTIFNIGHGSSQGFILLMQQFFSDKKICLNEFTACKRVLQKERMLCLNGEHQLGLNSVSGFQVEDKVNRFRINVSVLNQHDVQEYINDEYLNMIKICSRAYLKRVMDIELVFELEKGALNNAQLGNQNSTLLGQKFWLASQNESIGSINIVL
jgi:predicted component of type VI protein secretion system